jgi:hypothetical protein
MSRSNVARAIIAFLLAGSIPATAGELTNVRGMGMARSVTAVSRGLDGLSVNPATLALPDSGTVVIGLFPIGARVGTDITRYGIFRDYFTGVETDSGIVGRTLSAADKQAILDGFASSTGRMSGDLEFSPIAALVRLGPSGTLAFTVTDRFSANADVPKAYAEFLFSGNPPGSTYDFTGTRAQIQWTREWTVAYARALPTPRFLAGCTAGIGLKFVQGFAYGDLQHANTRFSTAYDGVLTGRVQSSSRTAGMTSIQNSDSGSFSISPAPAGTGWGLDLGLTADINAYLRVGISVTDIGLVTWSRDIETSTIDSAITIDNATVETQRRAIEDAFSGRHGVGGSFSTSLPTTFRLGAAAELHKLPLIRRIIYGELTAAADLAVGFHDVPGASTRTRISLGVEYRPLPFLPIRMGGSLGGESRSNFALGIGARIWMVDLDIATENVGWIFNHDNLQSGGAAVGLKVRL